MHISPPPELDVEFDLLKRRFGHAWPQLVKPLPGGKVVFAAASKFGILWRKQASNHVVAFHNLHKLS